MNLGHPTCLPAVEKDSGRAPTWRRIRKEYQQDGVRKGSPKGTKKTMVVTLIHRQGVLLRVLVRKHLISMMIARKSRNLSLGVTLKLRFVRVTQQ